MIDGKQQIVIFDGYNLLHRARSGFTAGDYAIVYNFFRQLRALVETLKPDRALFVTEGVPVARLEAYPAYKANRTVDVTDAAAVSATRDFQRQKAIAVELLNRCFPVTVVRHREYECDDVIYTIVKHGAASTDYTIVSTDSDFTQMLQEFDNVRIYDPKKKVYVEPPEYDYLLWKSLRGDSTDNIPALPGVGDKTAEALVLDCEKLRAFLAEDASRQAQFVKNSSLIKLAEIGSDEEDGWESSSPHKDWDAVRSAFDKMKFASMLKESYWEKFIATFDSMFGERATDSESPKNQPGVELLAS